jgi:hypothetical protein
VPPEHPKPPELPQPKVCETCCECPTKPPAPPSCFDDLIAKFGKAATKGDRAKTSITDLQAFKAKANTALQDYTHAKYRELLARWVKLDADIVDFIKKLVCAIPCWYCVVECEICPLLHYVRDKERALYGTGARYTSVDSLKDLQYWWTREQDARKAAFDRVAAVMSAWEKPATTLDKILTDNATFLQNAGNILGSATATLLWDLFFKVIPMHLAMAPPADVRTTGIERKYTDLCPCDDGGEPDDCCGPNVGVLSLRARLIGPQPYLIHPSRYTDLICCLVTKRYDPAKELWTDAESEVAAITLRITNIAAEITARTGSLPQDAKSRLTVPVDCTQYRMKGGDDYDPPRRPPERGCCGDDRSNGDSYATRS